MIVVEGKSDTAAVQRAVRADTIETGGSAINGEIYRMIATAQNKRGVIVLTDPDHAGERLRKLISDRVPGCKHAFIERNKAATTTGKVGVEHASPADIRAALSKVKTEFPDEPPRIERSELVEAGLLLHPQAAENRRKLGDLLGIGYANGKQFYKRLRAFRIERGEFYQALDQLKREG